MNEIQTKTLNDEYFGERVAELRWDDPANDGTDFAHPAWWRGERNAVDMVAKSLLEILDNPTSPGVFGHSGLEQIRQRIKKLAGVK